MIFLHRSKLSENRNSILLLILLSLFFLVYTHFYLNEISTKNSLDITLGSPSLSMPIAVNVAEQKVPYEEKKPESTFFSKTTYLNQTRKSTENVIVFLVASASGDMRFAFNPYPRLQKRLIQLDERLKDNYTTDIIIFHTGYPSREDLFAIIYTIRRQIDFVNIDQIFYRFSPGFSPYQTEPTWSQRGKWNYHHMCYFWFKQVFTSKILRRYRYMMRLDDDSQILGHWPNVFQIMKTSQALYMANQREVDFEYTLRGMSLVRNLTADYIKEKKIIPRNPAMMTDFFNKAWEIPNYWNNFEIVDLEFFHRKDVQDYMDVIDRSQGIFLYRWGDAPLRYITLALFANETEILHRQKLELAYCHPC